MNPNIIDLTNCDKEPIHIPGSIQSHGFLIAVNTQSLIITYASENSSHFIAAEAKSLLGLPLAEFEHLAGITEADGHFLQLLRLGEKQNNFEIINPYPILINDIQYYLIISVSGTEYLLEFEPVTLAYDLQNQVGKSVSKILNGKNLQSLLHNTAKEIKNIIGYDRVMIYKFLEDGHGEVVEEVKNDDLDSFYGLHYPASDIPKQARELYKLNYVRIIADVNTASSPILTKENHAALDLTHSVLRAVSPIHIQYLKNMGVESSFSISLIAHGELWGLIACHNYTPRYIDYKAREASKLIGEIVSSSLEYKQDDEQAEQNDIYQEAISSLNTYLGKDENIISALTGQKLTLKDTTSATGMAILFEGELSVVGLTPDLIQLTALFDWLHSIMDDHIYYTNNLPDIFSPAITYKELGSGIIACMLSREMKEMVVWFKPEQLSTIKWAGNPEKPVVLSESGAMNLSPRLSFESFSQLVERTSVKWTKTEVINVLKIREVILNAVNKKAGAIRILNERLKKAYDELDTFSYTLSHDLKTPLTSIKSYTELVIMSNKSLDEQGKKLLGRVVAGANKMELLINEILNLAKVGRSELKLNELDMNLLIREISAEVASSLHVNVSTIITTDLPSIKGDHTLIMQLFTNLISNAVKYSAGAEQAKVTISSFQEGEEIIFKIQDNGIGIKPDNHEHIFELFTRMDNVKDIEGTGVGLAIVKRIVERHNARIWFESELNTGTVFYLAFKK